MSLPPFRRKPVRRDREERPTVPIDESMLLLLAAVLAGFMMLMAVQANAAGAAVKRLPAPKATGPADGGTFKVAPTFAWAAVKGAARYEFQLAADDKFESIVGSRREGSFKTENTFATVTTALTDSPPGHGYFWRVRAIDARSAAGRWSSPRKVVKAWPDVPELLEPADGAGASIGTANPTVLRWTRVPHAFKYRVRIARDRDMANLVLGDRKLGVETSATALALPGPLAAGEYFWDVTPMDSLKHTGKASAARSFTVTWNDKVEMTYHDLAEGAGFNVRFPADTTDLLGDAWKGPRLGLAERRVVDPQLSWNAVQGAASYQVEVNFSFDFAVGSKVCCDELITGTSVSPRKLLPNNTYFTRIRAVDPDGNAGGWNVGPTFRKSFDLVCLRNDGADCVTVNQACVETADARCLPTVPGLRLRDNRGPSAPPVGASGLPTTHSPVVSWLPVAGASSYEVMVGPWTDAGKYCNWSVSPSRTFRTAVTSWTPLGPSTRGRPVGAGAPIPSTDGSWGMTAGVSYCVRVRARSDRDANREEIVSEWTQLGGVGHPALTYGAPPSNCFATSTPASAYHEPADDPTLPPKPPSEQAVKRTPLFTWDDVDGACGYFVVVARDPEFTNVVDVAFTRAPAYAPRTTTAPKTYADETTSYFWTVMPTVSTTGDGLSTAPQENHPQSFQKRSDPPVLYSVRDTSGQPEFRWSAVEGARHYRIQVDEDPSFSRPIDDVLTNSTSLTSSATYPADSHLYWRVRADDETVTGLTWSETGQFDRSLPGATPKPDSDPAGLTEVIPTLGWSAAERAVFYEVHVEQVDGSKLSFRTTSTALTPIAFFGTGVWKWRVRAHFRSGSADVGGPWSDWQYITRHIATPVGIQTTKRGRGIALAWAPAPMAKQYRVEISTDDSFSTIVERATTPNTSFAPKMTSPGFDGSKPLYWRVAAVDEGNNIGGWATTQIRNASVMRVKLTKRGRRAVLVRVKDGRKKAVKGALVRVTGAGLPTVRKRTGKHGTVTVKVKGAKRGKLLFHVEKRGYVPKDVKFRVR
jgi:hypothetical protein